MKPRHFIALAALLSLSAPHAAFAQDQAQSSCAVAKPKKKGFGLGGLLSAAKRAGVGDMLTGRAGNLLGGSKGGQIVGAVAGTALSAADSGGSATGGGGVAGALSGLAGHGHAAQIAGAVTGVVAEAASGAGSACAN